MASRGQGRAGGRGNREREDRGKRPMVDPDPIREPVEETFEEEELAPIIMAQPTVPPRPVNVGEGSSGRKRKRKKGNKKSYEATKARTTNNHYIRHVWFKWFAENVEHKDIFRRYNTPGTSMGIRRFVEHLCELGRQTYVLRRQMIPTLSPWDKPIKTTLELWAQQVPSNFKDEIEKGSYGSVYHVGFQHVALGKELGMEKVVSYVAKKCDVVSTNSAWVMMHKELASFAKTHCAIVQSIACHNIEAEPLLVYPYWNGRHIFQWMRLEHVTRGTRLPDNSRRSGNMITDHPDWFPDPGDWIAPELVVEKIRELARKSIIIRPINEYNKATDVYALGVLTQKVCEDFFTDMTKPKWKAYNDKYYDE
ncbi:hypothetical protein R1sor_001818 [Riccia sorocarpa]|uniref:Uncharacterized protein n=1 Tax=Riccia sorocarpa TaxID=122646 RepID=A0ABD3GYN7_9MARC